jgi:hypothetical protein
MVPKRTPTHSSKSTTEPTKIFIPVADKPLLDCPSSLGALSIARFHQPRERTTIQRNAKKARKICPRIPPENAWTESRIPLRVKNVEKMVRTYVSAIRT